MLVIMGLASYIFVSRTLDHTHELTVADLIDAPSEQGAPSGKKDGKTWVAQDHFHHVTLDADGNGVTDIQQGHFHRVHAETVDGKTPAMSSVLRRKSCWWRVPIYVDDDDPERVLVSRPVGQAREDWNQRR